MYSQLPSITGGRSSIRNLRTRHAVVTGTHLTQIKIYRNTVFTLVLYEHETWSLKLRKEDRRRVFENMGLGKIFGPRREE
jgi:hypothetical protein